MLGKCQNLSAEVMLAFYDIWRFITVFTRSRYWLVTWATFILSSPSHFVAFKSHFTRNIFFHFEPGCPNRLFPSRFPKQNSLCISFLQHACTMTRPSHDSWWENSPETWKRSAYHEDSYYTISLASSHFLSVRSEYSLFSKSSIYVGLSVRDYVLFLLEKPTRCTISQIYFGKQLYMFRPDLLSTLYAWLTVHHL